MSFDASATGTTTAAWRDDARWIDAPVVAVEGIESLVVVAAHADDETLGAGGIIHACALRGIPIEVVIVTDGAASHPGDALTPLRRAREAHSALAVLAPRARLTLLGFADGDTDDHRNEITAALAEVLTAAPDRSIVLAPWRGDGHRDHRVVGEIAASLVTPARLWEYPVWMWHWGHPDHPDIEWSRMHVVTIDPSVKQRAVDEYSSQTGGELPIVSSAVLDAAATDREFVIGDPAAFASSAMPQLTMAARSSAADPIIDYLDRAYAHRDDPWHLETRWYEQRKRAMTLASLPARLYPRALELGCSIGVLTADLAERCGSLLAVDLSTSAVEQTRVRLDGRAGVTVEQLDIRRDVPSGPFDLVVLSEIGYYLSHEQLDEVLAGIELAIGDRGTLLACHWRHPVAEHLLTGDEVHAAIAARGLPRIARHDEADFIIDVYSRDACSVAQHEGIT